MEPETMRKSFSDWVIHKVSLWLLKSQPHISRGYLTNFQQLCTHAQPSDILLFEGHSRASNIISLITQSIWTHAALYIGNLEDIKDSQLRDTVKQHTTDLNGPFLIESEIGYGTIITPLTRYKDENIRLLRPSGLTQDDAQKIIGFTIRRLGMNYDIRHLFDLARFLFPWKFFPKQWHSSLFQHNALQPTKDICSSMIAEAFESVDYPILPLIDKDSQNQIEFIRRNVRLYTPNDFDLSPYFNIIKYPYFPLRKKGSYHHLPWMHDVVTDDNLNKIFVSPQINQFFSSKAYAVIGASADRNKFGNKVLRCYIQQNKIVYPVNPHADFIEGLACITDIESLPNTVNSISIITKPSVTEGIVDAAIKKGIQNIWMQPGAESHLAIEKCKQHHINIIADGTCILQEFNFHE